MFVLKGKVRFSQAMLSSYSSYYLNYLKCLAGVYDTLLSSSLDLVCLLSISETHLLVYQDSQKW